MGMSASQCRLLSLTARMSDLEYQAQSISNSKIRLSTQSEEVARNYSDALNKEKLTVMTGVDTKGVTTYKDATAANLTGYNAISTTEKQRFIKDSAGKVIVSSTIKDNYDAAQGKGDVHAFLTNCGVEQNTSSPNYDESKIAWYTNLYNEIKESGGCNPQSTDNLNSPEWLQQQVTSGNISLFEKDETGDFVDVSWTSGDSSIQSKSDDTDMARAEAEYKVKTAEIQTKDKRFDLDLQSINTEHTAIQTEVDSVKKTIEKNIDRSFKIFSA